MCLRLLPDLLLLLLGAPGVWITRGRRRGVFQLASFVILGTERRPTSLSRNGTGASRLRGGVEGRAIGEADGLSTSGLYAGVPGRALREAVGL